MRKQETELPEMKKSHAKKMAFSSNEPETYKK